MSVNLNVPPSTASEDNDLLDKHFCLILASAALMLVWINISKVEACSKTE